jgi:hypothetical protein
MEEVEKENYIVPPLSEILALKAKTSFFPVSQAQLWLEAARNRLTELGAPQPEVETNPEVAGLPADRVQICKTLGNFIARIKSNVPEESPEEIEASTQ